ncbi:MAG TPA: phage/plasmid primase, P4 family, partial [Rhizomicrobium sp.]|nr:phage/plasmid primase, P4 family [Rhizomicrobium sp.]
DADPWLLNSENGTIDLRTGKLRPHRREDLITKIVPAAFDPAAGCPRFDRFIQEVMGDRRALVEFLQKAIGYTLTGIDSARCMFFLHGTGANGKSTFVNLFEHLLGDYARSTPVHTLQQKKNDSSVSDDLARLRGARLVTASEVEEGRKFDVALLKRLTSGGDSITARHLYGKFFQFRSTMKLWIPTNHKPKISGSDEAIWDRIHLVPFDQYFSPGERDPGLSDQLKSELPGILNWAIRGCLAWQREGLKAPEEVRVATDSYRSEMNELGHFIEECLVLEPSARTSSSDMSHSFTRWAQDNGATQVGQPELKRRLEAAGIHYLKSGSFRGWRGCRLISSHGNAVGTNNRIEALCVS